MATSKIFSKLVWIVLMIIAAVLVVYAARHCAGPLTTVLTGGIERAEPAIDKAQKARESVERTNRATSDALKKIAPDVEP